MNDRPEIHSLDKHLTNNPQDRRSPRSRRAPQRVSELPLMRHRMYISTACLKPARGAGSLDRRIGLAHGNERAWQLPRGLLPRGEVKGLVGPRVRIIVFR